MVHSMCRKCKYFYCVKETRTWSGGRGVTYFCDPGRKATYATVLIWDYPESYDTNNLRRCLGDDEINECEYFKEKKSWWRRLSDIFKIENNLIK